MQTNANQGKPGQTRASALFFACIPASILAMGGSSKFYDASSNYGPSFLNTQEWLFFFALPLLELLSAIALIAFTRLAILPAFAMHSTFLGFLFATEISGVVECNCFGSIESHVRIIAALDLLALSALLISAKIVWTTSPYVVKTIMPSLLVSFGTVGYVGSPFYTPGKPGPLRCEYKTEDLIGAVPDYQLEAKLTNRSNATIEIANILPSCECAILNWTACEISPGESKTISASVDLSRAFSKGQRFAKHLVEATCYDNDGAEVAEILLFRGRSSRSFELLEFPKSKLWTPSFEEQGLSVGFSQFDFSNDPPRVFVNDSPARFNIEDDQIRVFFPPPKEVFSFFSIEISQGTGNLRTKFQRSLLVNCPPPHLEMQINLSENKFSIDCFKKDFAASLDVRRSEERVEKIEHNELEKGTQFQWDLANRLTGQGNVADISFGTVNYAQKLLIPIPNERKQSVSQGVME